MQVHAHLLIASTLEDAEIPAEYKRESADVRHYLYDSFGITEARRLIEESSVRPLQDQRYQFVIVAGNITLEAQNALLKLFEEPPADVEFYLVVPHESLLLATLRSRLITSSDRPITRSSESGDRFLSGSLKQQLEHVADLAKRDPGELSRLAVGLSAASSNPQFKRSLLQTTKYVYNRGASRKMLLEELILSLHAKTK